MNSKFQEIISTPAIVVPAMTTEEINLTLLDASVQCIKKNITLETLTLLAAKIQHFMGMRGEDSRQIENMMSQIRSLSNQQKDVEVFDSAFFESVNQSL